MADPTPEEYSAYVTQQIMEHRRARRARLGARASEGLEPDDALRLAVEEAEAHVAVEEAQARIEEQAQRISMAALRLADEKARDTAPMPDDLTDAKIAASEARTETKFAELRGELALISANLASIGRDVGTQRTEAASNRNVMVATTIGTGLAIIGAIVAMLSYGAATFYNGTVMRDAINSAVSERLPASSEQKK